MSLRNYLNPKLHLYWCCLLLSLSALGQTVPNDRGLGSLRLISVALSVGNLAESVAWYRDKLGFALASTVDNKTSGFQMAVVEKNGLKLELIHRPGSRNLEGKPKDPPDHLQVQGLRNLVLGVDDLAATNAYLKAKGVRLIWESKFIPEAGVAITNFRDPDGNLIAIWGKP